MGSGFLGCDWRNHGIPKNQHVNYIQAGGVIASSWTRRQGYYTHIKKEVGFMVYSWIKETGLANLARSSLRVGTVIRGHKEPGAESYSGHFHCPHTLSTFTLGLGGKALSSLGASPRGGFASPVGPRHWFVAWPYWCQQRTSLRTSPTPHNRLWNLFEVGRWSEYFWWGLPQILSSDMRTVLSCEFSEAGGSHAFSINMGETPIFIILFLPLSASILIT